MEPEAVFAVTGTAVGMAVAPAFVAAVIAVAAELTDSTLPVTIGAFSTLAGAGAEYNSILLATFEAAVATIEGVAVEGVADPDPEAAGTGTGRGTAGIVAAAD